MSNTILITNIQLDQLLYEQFFSLYKQLHSGMHIGAHVNNPNPCWTPPPNLAPCQLGYLSSPLTLQKRMDECAHHASTIKFGAVSHTILHALRVNLPTIAARASLWGSVRASNAGRGGRVIDTRWQSAGIYRLDARDDHSVFSKSSAHV